MRIKVERYSITIIPDGEAEVAYLEETLGLAPEGPGATVERVNAIGLSCLACITIRRKTESPAP